MSNRLTKKRATAVGKDLPTAECQTNGEPMGVDAHMSKISNRLLGSAAKSSLQVIVMAKVVSDAALELANTQMPEKQSHRAIQISQQLLGCSKFISHNILSDADDV